MLVTLPFCLRDEEITLKLFDWIAELQGLQVSSHELWLLRDARCDKTLSQAITASAQRSFTNVHEILAAGQVDGWPEGANYMFRTIASTLAYTPYKYFMWMEPDAIPLTFDWLDKIEQEYLASRKPFMGDRVEVNDIPLHMSGVGVYQNPIYLLAGEAYRAADIAWDMAAKDQIVPNAHFTKLIEHAWRHETFTNRHELTTQIRPEAVLFHASKDGSLIKLLRDELHQAGQGRNASIHSDIHETRSFNQAQVENETIQKSVEFSTSGGGQGNVPSIPSETQRSAEIQSTGQPARSSLQRQDSETGEVRTMRSEDFTSRPSSKLRQQAGSKMAVPAVSSAGTQSSLGQQEEANTPPAVVYDIFIRTYPVDYPWLEYCLRSITQYAKGFRKIWVVSPEKPTHLQPLVEWKVMNEESTDGYLSQQIHKLYADVITNYEPDYILHIDSDTLFTRPVTPQDFFKDGKLIWYYTPYEQTETPWKPITEKFMGIPVANEFMRRLPMMVPRALYDVARKYCFDKHNQILSEYVRKQPYREFSEFNVLGAVAYESVIGKNIEWIDTTKGIMPEPFARQFYSWGGLTDEVKAEIQTILGGKQQEHTRIDQAQKELEEPSSPAQNIPNGEMTVGEHVLWLLNYAEGSPSKRQYVMGLLDKANLKKLRRGRRKRNVREYRGILKGKIEGNTPAKVKK